MRLAAWNVNHRAARRRVPSWVTSAIASTGSDMIVLTEYVEGLDHEEFVRNLRSLGYPHVACSERAPRQNGVFIASREALRQLHLPVDSAPAPLASNHLMVELEGSGLRVLGIRMPYWTGERAQRLRAAGWRWLSGVLDSIQVGANVVIGDFNREPTVDGLAFPGTHATGWRTIVPVEGGSFRPISGSRERRLDYALVSTEIEAQHCFYDWGFQQLDPDARRRAAGVPDHAMLILDLKLATEAALGRTRPSIERGLLVALRHEDAQGIFRYGFAAGTLLPSEHLSAELVPASPKWGGTSAAEAFALLFDGYAWAEGASTDLWVLSEAVEFASSADSLADYSVDALRAALFGIQRKYHDSPDRPRRQSIERVLTAIRAKAKPADQPVMSVEAER